MSEDQPQRELNLPRAGALVLHTSRRDLPKRRTADRDTRIIEVRMVERVEDLPPELQVALLFAEREPLQHGRIPTVGRGTDDDVAPGAAVSSNEVVREAGGIEPLRGVVREIVWIAGDVRTRAGLRAGKLEAGRWIERIAALNGDDAVRLPASEQRVYHRRTTPAERAPVPVWQVI